MIEKNNFDPIGNRPLAPTVYDENITPLESINKLTYKINELIGDDTNVKEVVDKLLDIYKEHMMLKAGYCEPLKCIAFENPLYGAIGSSTSNITYEKVVKTTLAVSAIRGEPTFYQWQYKNENGLFVDLTASGSNSKSLFLPLTFYNDGDSKEFRCKLQNDKYTYYTDSYKISYVQPTINISQTYQNIGVNLYSQNTLNWQRKSGQSFTITNKEWQWKTENSEWQVYPVYSDTLKPYYYIDAGIKTNGISVGEGEVGTDKIIQWRYRGKVGVQDVYSNVLTTTVHIVDFDCGTALLFGESCTQYDADKVDMVQRQYYYDWDNSDIYLMNYSLNINKSLNNDVITSIQWLYSSSWTKLNGDEYITSLLQGATDIKESGQLTVTHTQYLTNTYFGFRLQVVVGNKAYYSLPVYTYLSLMKINISYTPTGTQAVGTTYTFTGTPSNYPVEVSADSIYWQLSVDNTNWFDYAHASSCTVKTYADNNTHDDGIGIGTSTRFYVRASIDVAYGKVTISVKQS